jgi:hypothetical protein
VKTAYRSFLSANPFMSPHYCDHALPSNHRVVFQNGRLKTAEMEALERGKHILFVDALVRSHQPQDAVEGADTQGGVIWNRDALRGWLSVCKMMWLPS